MIIQNKSKVFTEFRSGVIMIQSIICLWEINLIERNFLSNIISPIHFPKLTIVFELWFSSSFRSWFFFLLSFRRISCRIVVVSIPYCNWLSIIASPPFTLTKWLPVSFFTNLCNKVSRPYFYCLYSNMVVSHYWNIKYFFVYLYLSLPEFLHQNAEIEEL